MLSGRDIKGERVRQGYTQSEIIGELTGVDLHSLIRIERGDLDLTQDAYQRIIGEIRALKPKPPQEKKARVG